VAEDDVPEGYPDSPEEELTPLEPMLSLEFADRELEEEGEVSPRGAAPAEDGPDADRLADSPDADQLAAVERGKSGSGRQDAANFQDNAAEWSRERT
jgi:hypothetical protein